MTYQQAIQQACEIVGSQASLAKAIGVTPAIVHQWRSGTRPVPVQHCLAIERATHGAVTRRDLRPTDWRLIWPEMDGAQALWMHKTSPKRPPVKRWQLLKT